MLQGLKMGWVFKKPARLACPSDDSHLGLNTVSPLLGEFVSVLSSDVLDNSCPL